MSLVVTAGGQESISAMLFGTAIQAPNDIFTCLYLILPSSWSVHRHNGRHMTSGLSSGLLVFGFSPQRT